VNEEDGEKTDPSGLVKKINDAMTQEPAQQQTSAFPELTLDEQTIRSFTEYEEHRLRENVRKGVNLFSIRLALDNATFDQELREITEILANYGEIISTLPSFDTTAGPDKMVFRLIFGTAEKEDGLRKKLERDDVQIVNLRKEEEAPAEPGAMIVEEEPEMER